MDLSHQELEAIQRAAGILGATVDELIQFRRRQPPSSSTGGVPERHDELGTTTPKNPPDDLPVEKGHSYSPLPCRQLPRVPAQGWPEDGQCFAPSGVERSPVITEQYPTMTASSSAAHSQNHATEVILLNPHTACYECDMGFLGIGADLADTSPRLGPSTASDNTWDHGFAQLLPTPPSDSDSNCGSAVQEILSEDISIEGGSEWGLVSSSSGLIALSATVGSQASISRKRQYALIEPRPGAEVLSQTSSSATLSPESGKKRRKRAPYKQQEKRETKLTRQNNACVRCRMQRNRCIPDPRNPSGPCKPCQEKATRISRLPCLRYKVTECTLFRTRLDYMPFYKEHPLVGPSYGDFHLEREWTQSSPRYLCLTQDRGPYHHTSFLQIELREFVPPANDTAVDLKGYSMYSVPWAIADQDSVVREVNTYIDQSMDFYMDGILDDTDGIEWDVFHMAYRASIFPVPNMLLRKVLRLWVACRFIEGKWRCWGDDDIKASNPRGPSSIGDSPPPYLDYQLASVIIQRVLVPLREQVLRDLQGMVLEHKPEDWFVTFLVSFILLHNYELQMQFQLKFASKRKSRVLYLDMPLVRATNSGAKTILAHFHYCCKGQRPFGEGFDWNKASFRKMARLDLEQAGFMANYRDLVTKKGETLGSINQTHLYHEKYWYTSQLFDPDWIPRKTLEHVPAIDQAT